MIRARHLEVRFGATIALQLERLDVNDGETVAIVGANGCGKSTLLRVLAGLIRPSRGELDGVPPPGRAVLVHQDPYFFSGTARENMAWVLRQAGRPSGETAAWLQRAHATHLADRPASRLSGGEKHRLAIARALAVGPELLLLDEPFSGVDEKHRSIINDELRDFSGTLVVASPENGHLSPDREVTLRSARD